MHITKLVIVLKLTSIGIRLKAVDLISSLYDLEIGNATYA